MKGKWLFVVLMVSSVVRVAHAALPAELNDFDAYVEQVRKEFNVPGIAVAIVKDGDVVLERGYGRREINQPAAVDEHTMFAIASNTKAFTAASLALLVDEGKLRWDDRVVEHLPWFRMSDPYVTREMTVRDLLAHRSGLSLGAGDLLFWPTTDFSTRDVVERLKDVPLTTSFRSAYAYDNILYAAAGLTIEAASGKSWSDYVRERILRPLGMDETRINFHELKPGENFAVGHALYNFTDLKPVAPLAWHNNSAAGGLYSSVHDLAKWLRVQLARGERRDENKTAAILFKPERSAEMWSLVTPIAISEPKIEALKVTKPNFRGYGLGWDLSDYRGRKVVSHTGGWPGQVSKVAMIPEIGLGVVVLTNQESGAAFQAVTWRVLDAYLNAPRTDWVKAYAESVAKAKADSDESWAKHVAARDANAKPTLPLARYAGTYRDRWRGDVAIAEENGKLVLRFSHTENLSGTLEFWQHSTFIVRWADRSHNADAFVTFALDADGKIERVTMRAISPLTDFSFDFQDLDLRPVSK